MTNSRRHHTDENVMRAGLWHGQVVKFQRASLMDKSDGFHVGRSVGEAASCVHAAMETVEG
jgi:hypothetical protein